MLFWLGVALLCLGGDAPIDEDGNPHPAETNAAEVAQAAESTDADAPADEPLFPQSFLADYAPAPVEGPGLRLPVPQTRFYLDGGYGRTDDLSGLPLVAGSAYNYRFAAGGSLALGHFSLDGELTFSNITTIDVTQIPGGTPIDVDKHQRATSLGDLRLGATWTHPLDHAGALIGGFGLRARLPTHTVVFQFHLVDMVSLGKYVFPYYFHIEPTAIFAASVGRLGFIANEGVTLMTGPDGNFQDLRIIVPNLLFWSAHYAIVWSPLSALALAADLQTDVQLNRVTVMYFEKVNGLVSADLNIDLQIHFGQYRVDLIGRRGLTQDSEVFGVLQYAGTNSLTLRFGASFD